MELALRLQFKIVEAATFAMKEKFPPLFRALQKVKVTEEIALKTGLGVIVADTNMWCEKLQPEVKVLELSWRKRFRNANPVYGIDGVNIETEVKPWNNQKREHFLDKASNIATYMKHNDDVESGTRYTSWRA